MATPTDDIAACLQKRYWSFFLASSLIIFFGGIIVILFARLICYCTCCKKKKKYSKKNVPEGQVSCFARIKMHCQALLSGQKLVGRIIVFLSVLLSIGSLIIYMIDASGRNAPAETCQRWTQSVSQIVDFAFNIFFMAVFIIRFIAANDKLSFWVEIPSFVDYFTIPPSFVGLALNRQWLGLRFLRALRFLALPDILQYMSVLQTSSSIRLAQLASIFISVWLTGAGFIHLVETTGDPFHNFSNFQDLTFWESVYYVVVTMSTVGYGDIYCVTTIGRIFMVIFIFGALAMFASFIPEMAEILGNRQKYAGAYEKPAGIKHIILCGHITYDSVQNFLKDFLHEDRENTNVKCVFLDSKSPDLELEALFKRHFTRVTYLKGSVMSTRDLERAQLQDADACLVLANPRSSNPDAEDAANIMRVISLKNYYDDIRVVVQLIRFNNKAFCVNLPSWQPNDQVICLSEMKLGFMAQGCLAPGFSTLLANLFVMRAYKKSSQCIQWQEDYLSGAGMEVYTNEFSSAFHGKSFPEAAQFCFSSLKVLLVAVAVRKNNSDNGVILLNPGSKFLIDKDVTGFFICQSEEEAKRPLYFCNDCHSGRELEIAKECRCSEKAQFFSIVNAGHYKPEEKIEHLEMSPSSSANDDICDEEYTRDAYASPEHLDSGHSSCSETNVYSPRALYESARHQKEKREKTSVIPEVIVTKKPELRQRVGFDATGLFHWCPTRQFEDCLLSSQTNTRICNTLEKHIVLCIFGQKDDPSTGICSFVMPLRSSAIKHADLRKIVIIGEEKYLKREWSLLANFPDVFIKSGSPLDRSDLRQIRIDKCHMCVILTTNETSADDVTLVDKEAMLCSLNIKTMSFTVLPDAGSTLTELSQTERASMLIKSRGSPTAVAGQAGSGVTVPMLTELANEYNAQFLDQDDEDDPDTPLYMTQPFACGRAFAASVLDTIMSTAYFNSDALNLIRMLLTGGATNDLEQLLAEGLGFVEGKHGGHEIEEIRNRSRVTLLPLDQGILQPCSKEDYGQLFASALQHLGVLCIGLYRQMEGIDEEPNPNRYIVTNPPSEAMIYSTDQIFCLVPFVTSSCLTSAHGVDTKL